MIVLLLLTYFIINDDIGLKGGLLYTTNMTQTFHMFIYTISILMLQLTSSSGSNSLNTRAFGFYPPGSKSNSFNSLNPYSVHPAWSSPQSGIFYGLPSSIRWNSSSTNNSVVPVKLYKNADLDMLQILKENKAKSGIYRWVNLTNRKSYVGSSVNLGRRLKNYFNINFISDRLRGKSLINAALQIRLF